MNRIMIGNLFKLDYDYELDYEKDEINGKDYVIHRVTRSKAYEMSCCSSIRRMNVKKLTFLFYTNVDG